MIKGRTYNLFIKRRGRTITDRNLMRKIFSIKNKK